MDAITCVHSLKLVLSELDYQVSCLKWQSVLIKCRACQKMPDLIRWHEYVPILARMYRASVGQLI